MHCLANVEQECGGVLHRSCCMLYTGHAARFKPVMLRVIPVMLRVTSVMLRAVAASRKSPWDNSRPGSLDSATGAHNDGVRLPCSFRYAVAVARPLPAGQLRQAQLPRASTGSATGRPVAEPVEAKHQGLRSWTRRKPILLVRSPEVREVREAERKSDRASDQEPLRRTLVKPQPLVRALPSMGAPA